MNNLSDNWILYVSHPLSNDGNYTNIYSDRTLASVLLAAKDVPETWGCYIVSWKTRVRYDKTGIKLN